MSYRDLAKKAESAKRWRLANPDKVKEGKAKWRKKWREANKDKSLKQARLSYANYRELNPLKEKARYEVRKALRLGLLVKKPCIVCGESDLEMIEAHHVDYSRPLNIQWLCRNCHIELHNGRAREMPIFLGLEE